MTGLDSLVGRYEIDSPDDMEAFGARIGGMLQPGDLVVLTGALGAGKTTLTRGIAAGLGVRGPVQSPTFVIARTHPSLVGRAPLVHVDAYRLGSALELDDLDIDVDRSVVIVEWGRGMVDGLRDSVVGDRARPPARRPGCRDDVRRPLARVGGAGRRRAAHRDGVAEAITRGATCGEWSRLPRLAANGGYAADVSRHSAKLAAAARRARARRVSGTLATDVAAIAASTASGRSTFAK